MIRKIKELVKRHYSKNMRIYKILELPSIADGSFLNTDAYYMKIIAGKFHFLGKPYFSSNSFIFLN